jgi:hypothetical protein
MYEEILEYKCNISDIEFISISKLEFERYTILDYINKINKYYKYNRDMKNKKEYLIMVFNLIGKEQIHRLYNNEEKIWMIYEN